MGDFSETRFLNVDLDLLSNRPLDGLVQAFGGKVDVLHVGEWGRRYGARLEVRGSGRQKTAEPLIRRFTAMVKALPRSRRRLWDGALSRELNIGIEAAANVRAFELRLQPETLREIADVDARLAITVYAPARLVREAGATVPSSGPTGTPIGSAAPARTPGRRGFSRRSRT
jgi:hypothetical protein